VTTAAGAAVVTAALVLASIATVQVLGAAGRPVGRFLWGGQHDVLPRRLRIGSALSVLLYAVIILALVARSGAFGDVGTFASVTSWVLVGYFALGVVLNGISRSRAERLTMTPACLVLAVCCLVVATG
jgi:hypothetical protein